jgi:hypothetical protein
VSTALTDTILKGAHPVTIPARFGFIWFSGFRGEDLNVIFYQNMPNLHNRYISAERKISQKNPKYMFNYFLLCRNQTWQEWSLGGPLSKLCPSAPSCIQDGRHY